MRKLLTITITALAVLASFSSCDPKVLDHLWDWSDDNCVVFHSTNQFSIKPSYENGQAVWEGTLLYSDNPTDPNTWVRVSKNNAEMLTAALHSESGEYVLAFKGIDNTVISKDIPWITNEGATVAVDGDLRTLLDYKKPAETTMGPLCFASMFKYWSGLTTAPELPFETLSYSCYSNMFEGCSSLTQAPALPATTATEKCYFAMFKDCSSLATAPALPATTLADHCYRNMFEMCTSLAQAPALPSTSLAFCCYNEMFIGCSSLTQAPALPATTLANWCYSKMFMRCSSLVTAPALPATTLTEFCYECMFNLCSSLTQAPALPATTLAEYCYSGMFGGCTSLASCPALPATELAENCYNCMFGGCTQITEAPNLPATELKDGCYSSMFYGCYLLGIEEVAEGDEPVKWWGTLFLTTGTVNANGALSSMFKYCSTGSILTDANGRANYRYYWFKDTEPVTNNYIKFTSSSQFSITPSDWDGTLEYSTNPSNTSTWTIVKTNPMAAAYDSVSGKYVLYVRGRNNSYVSNGTAWTVTPSTVQIECSGDIRTLLNHRDASNAVMGENCFDSMFSGWTGLTGTPTLSASTLSKYCYKSMFSGCTSLTAAPALAATIMAEGCYESMFSGCTSLAQAPALPSKSLAQSCYASMFENCTFTTLPTLPATTMAQACYAHMFKGCTGITAAPDLSGTSVKIECFMGMFEGCTSLKSIGGLPSEMINRCYKEMFKNCSSLHVEMVWKDTTPTRWWGTKFFSITFLAASPEWGADMFKGCATEPDLVDSTGTINHDYYWFEAESTDPSPAYLTFSSENAFTIEPSTWDGDLQWTTTPDDIDSWTTMDKTKYIQATSALDSTSGLHVVYMRGRDNTYVSNGEAWTVTGSAVSCEGNITTLLEHRNTATATMGESCFASMFSDCTALVQAPTLDPTSLTDNCYSLMFSDCTNLEEAPELPATELAKNCYESMFKNCTSLTEAPVLPATQLKDGCYTSMFSGCTSLNIEEVPAGTEQKRWWGTRITTIPTDAEEDAITGMFSGTSALSVIYSADTMQGSTYYWFDDEEPLNCLTFSSSTQFYIRPSYDASGNAVWNGTLMYSTDTDDWDSWSAFNKTTPTNAAAAYDSTLGKYVLYIRGVNNTVISEYEYWDIFDNLSVGYVMYDTTLRVSCDGNIMSLLDHRDPDHATMGRYCFTRIFGFCYALTKSPDLPATQLSPMCYTDMFEQCRNLTDVPDVLPATSLPEYCYCGMFDSCTSLTEAPALPAMSAGNRVYERMFYKCTSLVTAPDLPATNVYSYCYSSMFGYCTSLVNAPALPASTAGMCVYQNMFVGCTSLTQAPALPATKVEYGAYSGMFSKCTALQNAPAISATTLGGSCYAEMFKGCTALTAAPALNVTTLADNCYNHMFDGCTNLTSACALPATTLKESCYEGMFAGCSKLQTAPAISATALAKNCCKEMFSGCTKLSSAPSLPVTTLAEGCYRGMFVNCTALTSAPTLAATTLKPYCYESMFYGCSSLKIEEVLSGSTPVKAGTLIVQAPAALPTNAMLDMFTGCSASSVRTNAQPTGNCSYYWFI